MTTPNTIPVKSLHDVAVTAAINAAATNDRSTWRAVTSVSLLMVCAQIKEIDDGKPVDDARNKSAFRAFTKLYASKGHVVWRGTEHLVTAIMARKGQDKLDAVNAYIDGSAKGKSHPCDKPEGAKYAENLATLRKWSFRLMNDVCTNYQDEVRHIRSLRESGASPDAQIQYFKNFVGSQYGETFAKLSHSLPGNAPKKESDPVESIMNRAEKMTDTELHRLVTGLNTLWNKRAAIQAEVPIDTGDNEANESGEETALERELEAA